MEGPEVDFKESATWGALKWKITRTALAMANLNGGGLVLVGVSERDGRIEVLGISPTDLDTFDPDHVRDHVNLYASPFVEIEVATVTYDSKMLLAVRVLEFRETPVVCKRAGPEKLEVGNIYVRTRDSKPESSRIRDAAHLHELLERAAVKRARALIERATEAGMVPGSASASRYSDELGGL